MRNEMIEELIADVVREVVKNEMLSLEVRGEPAGESRKRAEDEKKGGQAGKRGHEVALGKACLSEEGEQMSLTESVGQAIVNPSELAKSLGTPNKVILSCPDVETRALRASRCAQLRRV
jgi:hypothetical protein